MSLTLRLLEGCFDFVIKHQITFLIAVGVTLHFLFQKRRLRKKLSVAEAASHTGKGKNLQPQKDETIKVSFTSLILTQFTENNEI